MLLTVFLFTKFNLTFLEHFEELFELIYVLLLVEEDEEEANVALLHLLADVLQFLHRLLPQICSVVEPAHPLILLDLLLLYQLKQPVLTFTLLFQLLGKHREMPRILVLKICQHAITELDLVFQKKCLIKIGRYMNSLLTRNIFLLMSMTLIAIRAQ